MTKRVEGSREPRAEELLVERALRPLDAAELAELDELGVADDHGFDLAAAAAVLAVLGPAEPLPAHLAARIAASAPVVTARPRRRAAAMWLFAATCLGLAIAAWWWAGAQDPVVAVIQIPVAPPAPPSAGAARAALLAQVHDVVTTPWVATKDVAGRTTSGDVVWSASTQRGYMRFVGLPPNDPARAQYQLWIFDRARDERYPVDGGLFDVSSAGELVVPITARIPVADPTLFAITIEPPGGVVVSKRERIVVTATPSQPG